VLRDVPVVGGAPVAGTGIDAGGEFVGSTAGVVLDPLFSLCACALPADSAQRIVKTEHKTTHTFRDDMINLLCSKKYAIFKENSCTGLDLIVRCVR
jgi:hypothetical protein